MNKRLLKLVITVFLVIVTASLLARVARAMENEKGHLKEIMPQATYFSEKFGYPPRYEGYRLGSFNRKIKTGIAFLTTDLFPKETLRILIGMDMEGKITGIKILSHKESTVGSKIEEEWFQAQFRGKTIRDNWIVGRDVDAITGATISSSKVIALIEKSIQLMVSEYNISGDSHIETKNIFGRMPKNAMFNIVIFIGLITLSMFGVLKNKSRLRNIVLLMSLIYLGFWAQYYLSFTQLSHILLFRLSPFMNFIKWYFLVMLVLFCTIFLGRVYCGWLCPFGAAQEFLYKIIPTAKIRLPNRVDKSFKKVKYGLLFLVLIGVFTTKNPYFANYEPFVTSFYFTGGLWSWIFLGIILASALAIYRPFCRCLCLVGTVQALISKLSLRKLKINERCNNCRVCIKGCPIAAIDIDLEKNVRIDSMECIRCQLCKTTCCCQAIE